MPGTDNRSLPEGLSPEARRARARFDRIYRKRLAKVQKVPLTILVWGPNPASETPAARKRLEIRDRLLVLGHNAMFSEELSNVPGNISEKAKEFEQVQIAHLVIVLIEGAPGALAETHDFGNHPDLYHKFLVMVPKEYRKGYSALGAIRDLSDATGGGSVYWYEARDLAACNVLSRAEKRAEALRNIHYRHGVGRN